MARRVVSVVRGDGAGVWSSASSLEANAYAVAEDIDLTLVLRGAGCELAIAALGATDEVLAGHSLAARTGGQDLRALLESGVPVVVDGACLAANGLAVDQLLDGVRVVQHDDVLDLLVDADAVVGW